MSDTAEDRVTPARGRWREKAWRIWDSDIFYSLRKSKVSLVSIMFLLLCLVVAAVAPAVAPHNPFDPRTLNIMDSFLPPVWAEGGDPRYLLGTDEQGRDLFSAILLGLRSSMVVAVSSVLMALSIGIVLGLVSGYVGGVTDLVIMRITDVMLTFPALLIALLTAGVAKAVLPPGTEREMQIYVLILAIGISRWPQFARMVRAGTLVERNKDYVVAAGILGIPRLSILFGHILPNVLPAVLVVTTLNFGQAILDEATISFLGIGLPSDQPSLGTLIRVGNRSMLSGEWWVVVFPSLTLLFAVLAINLSGDWLRDALNPRLR